MDLRIIRNSIRDRIWIFKSKIDVDNWLKNTKIKISEDNVKKIESALSAYFMAEMERRIDMVQDDIGVYTLNYKLPNFALGQNDVPHRAKEKTAAISAISTGAFFLWLQGVLIGPAGWITIGASVLGGWMLGEYAIRNRIAIAFFKYATNVQNQISVRLESIVDELIKKENESREYFLESPSKLSAEQLQIKKFLEARNIQYLVHFTKIDNVESILKYGLLSIQEMERKSIPYDRNDCSRLDNQPNAISLSITHVNESLYKKFRNENRWSDYTVIKIDPSVLYLEKNSRLYCQTNAATTTGHKGSSFDDLRSMFADYVSYSNSSGSHFYNRNGRANNETTDPQAEILWFTNIPPKYLRIDIGQFFF